MFCPVVLQLAWLFRSSICFTRVPALATCQSWANHKIQSQGSTWVHTLELFFTLSHTLPLHDFHQNTGFLSVELQTNWHKIKPTKWLIKFSLTIYIMLKKLSGNLLTGSKYVTVETKADVQFDRPNLKQTKINVHNVMPLHIKQKAKVDIQTPNPNQHACISSITAPLFQRSPYYLLL